MFLKNKDIAKILIDFEGKVFLQSKIYFIPSKKFFAAALNLFKIFCKVYNIKYDSVFNCIRFTDLYKLICFYKYKRYYRLNENKDHSSISIGSIFFAKNDSTEHVRNILLYKENDKIKIGFIEAQKFEFIEMNDAKDIKFLII